MNNSYFVYSFRMRNFVYVPMPSHMIITIKKDSKKEDVLEAISKISKKDKKAGVLDFFGKLKNSFGDGLEYQKKIRNELD